MNNFVALRKQAMPLIRRLDDGLPKTHCYYRLFLIASWRRPELSQMKVIPLNTWKKGYDGFGIFLFALLFTKRWLGPITLDLKKERSQSGTRKYKSSWRIKVFFRVVLLMSVSIYWIIQSRMTGAKCKNGFLRTYKLPTLWEGRRGG